MGLVWVVLQSSGGYADVAAHAWRYANQTGVQPLRQSPFYYWLIVAAGLSGGCFSAAQARAIPKPPGSTMWSAVLAFAAPWGDVNRHSTTARLLQAAAAAVSL